VKVQYDNGIYVCSKCGKVYDKANNVIETNVSSMTYAERKFGASIKLCHNCSTTTEQFDIDITSLEFSSERNALLLRYSSLEEDDVMNAS
jgi:hypothetical protein